MAAAPHWFIERTLRPALLRALGNFPAVMLMGPRQSGKTTLLRKYLGDTFDYVSLDSLRTRTLARRDPEAFLKAHPDPVIIDEVQYAPDLLSEIKVKIDTDRRKCGRFVLTGSQNLLLSNSISESLSGRVRLLDIFSLSKRERIGNPLASLPWQRNHEQHVINDNRFFIEGLWRSLMIGGYPELHGKTSQESSEWHDSYTRTYIERDVRTLRNIGDLVLFQDFMELVAVRSGQLFNYSDVARDLGISVHTVKAWLSVLHASMQVFIVRPYFRNIGKRLVKMPKVYFTDTGTLCYLAELDDPTLVSESPLAGPVLETAVLGEMMRALRRNGIRPRIHFWRTQSGEEVDFLVRLNGKLVPVEVKKSANPSTQMARHIETFQRLAGTSASHGYVVHSGVEKIPLGPTVTALPFAQL